MPLTSCHGAVGAAVGDDQQLEVGFGLIENGLNRQPDDVCPVVRRQEDADARHRYQPLAFPNEYGMRSVSSGRRYLSGLA